MRIRLLALALILIGLTAACSRDFPPTPTPTPPPPTPTIPGDYQAAPPDAPTATPWPYPWTDESAVMSGICFESAADAAGQTFVLSTADELNAFFELADNSRLCRQPVERHAFDFADGRILAGTWSRATGCAARHEIADVQRDDTARTLFVFLRLIVEGDCTYELVRPFWLGLSDVGDYEIQFVVS